MKHIVRSLPVGIGFASVAALVEIVLVGIGLVSYTNPLTLFGDYKTPLPIWVLYVVPVLVGLVFFCMEWDEQMGKDDAASVAEEHDES